MKKVRVIEQPLDIENLPPGSTIMPPVKNGIGKPRKFVDFTV